MATWIDIKIRGKDKQPYLFLCKSNSYMRSSDPVKDMCFQERKGKNSSVLVATKQHVFCI